MVVLVTFMICFIVDNTARAQVVDIEPTSVTAFENENVTFTCTSSIQDDWRSARFRISFDTSNIVSFVNNKGSCYKSSNKDPASFKANCGTLNGQFILEILKMDDRFHNQTVQCIVRYGTGADSDIIIEQKSYITLLIPTTLVVIKPTGLHNVVGVKTGEDLTFTCTTDSSRPAAWIQWYIDGKDITNKATPVILPDETKFLSTSTLVYTGNNADHNKGIYCEAMNIQGREKIKSAITFLFITLPATTITIEPAGDHDVVSVIEGSNLTFTCRTDLGRPAAWIEWYIRELNVTNQAVSEIVSDSTDSTQFTTTSTLVYTGNNNDHAKSIHCAAVNSEEGDKINSKYRSLYIIVPVTSLSIEPDGYYNEVSVVIDQKQAFVCTTDFSRPAAWIQWYVGDENITNKATAVTTADGSTSSLVYTGRGHDHDKIVYCEVVNIEGRQKVKSVNKILNIHIPVTVLTLTPVGLNDTVSVVSGETQDFTCTTNTIRPASWIQWYIGTRNVTDDAVPQPPIPDGNKFISVSKLTYTGKLDDHNKTVHCEAGDIEWIQKVTSANKILNIGFRPHPVNDVRAICDVDSIVIMWQSESNGGSEQMFRVVWHNLKSDTLTDSDNILDPGVGRIALYTTKLLPPMSYYKVTIESINVYGTVTSNLSVSCNTSGAVIASLSVTDSTLTFLAGFGSGAALIICINIVAIIASFLLKRRRRSLVEKSNVYEQTKNRTGDANIYNELTDFPTERQNPADSGDRTYEDISCGTCQTSKRDNKRKKRAIKSKSKTPGRRAETNFV